LEDAAEVELRQSAGQVGDPKLVEERLDLGRRQVDPEAAEQALQSTEAGDAPAAGEATEELAEQTLAGNRVDRDDHGVGVGLALEVDDEAEQVQVQWPEDQLEHLTGLRLRLGGARGQ